METTPQPKERLTGISERLMEASAPNFIANLEQAFRLQ
jgi:hypothetical protein